MRFLIGCLVVVLVAGISPAYATDWSPTVTARVDERPSSGAEVGVGLAGRATQPASHSERPSVTRRPLLTRQWIPNSSTGIGLEHLCNPGDGTLFGWYYRLVTHDNTTGTVVSNQVVCVPFPPDAPSPPPPPALPPVPDIQDVWNTVTIAPPALHTSPIQTGVTGLETHYWTDGTTTATVNATLDGYTITGTAHLVDWTLDTGDGTTTRSTQPGTQTTPLARHTYETKRTYTLQLTATWRATATLTGPGITTPTPIDLGTATLTTTRTYPVIEIIPQLTQ